jgi:signal transduction histidine kinase/ActR/RegA family two-component response regulator
MNAHHADATCIYLWFVVKSIMMLPLTLSDIVLGAAFLGCAASLGVIIVVLRQKIRAAQALTAAVEAKNRALLDEQSEFLDSEREMKRVQEHLDVMADVSRLIYWEMNLQQQEMSISKQCRNELGYTAEDIGAESDDGRMLSLPLEKWREHWHHLVHPDDSDAAHKQLHDCLIQKTDHYFQELRLRHHEGYYIWVAAAGRFVEPTLFVGSVVNINDYRKASMNAGNSGFLASMSHQIRNPMNAIMGMAEILSRDELPPSARESISVINEAANSLLVTINDILDYAKLESGALDIVPASYQLDSLLNDIVMMNRLAVQEKRLRFGVYVKSAIPKSYEGDEVRIRQVLVNLVSNAVKYTDDGYILLTVEKTPSTAEAGDITLRFTVRDTGIGIKSGQLGHIFDGFFQADAAASSKTSGTMEGASLGLAVSRNLSRLMGGDIDVQSVYGKGSVFIAEIPQKVACRDAYATIDPVKAAAANVLIYGQQNVYIDTILRVLDDFGVKYRCIAERAPFLREAAGTAWNFIFMNNSLLPQTRDILLTQAAAHDITVFTEWDEVGENELNMPDVAAFRGNIRFVPLPVYGNIIAAILEGRLECVKAAAGDSAAGGSIGSKAVPFIAPDARVLLVDDIPTNTKVVAGLIAPCGMQVDSCCSGMDAVRMVKQTPYDLVFMDHMMPGMDGVEAMQNIRELNGERFKALPIIALTANAMAGMRQFFLDAGFDDYLAKPIELARLTDVLHRWVPDSKKRPRLTDGG